MRNKCFSIDGALREGWELTKVNIGFLIAYQIILLFLVWLFGNMHNEGNLNPIQTVGWIIVVLGKMGLFKSALLLTKGLKPSFNQLFVNWRLLLSWLVASFIFVTLFSMGLFLLVAPSLFIVTVFGFYPFFILDKDLGPIEALKQSAKATRGIRVHLLFLFLTCIGLSLLGILFFGVGFLITYPIILIALATVYEKITGQSQTSIQPNDIFND